MRYPPQLRAIKDQVTDLHELTCNYGRYGHRRIIALLRREGVLIHHKKVERIWKEQSLNVPQKQLKKRLLWLNNVSYVRLRPDRRNQIWSYDLLKISYDGSEYTRGCLLSLPKRS